jgi:NADH-quinone oxidoreductase subunit C
MTAQEILDRLQKSGRGWKLSYFPGPVDPAIIIDREHLVAVAETLRDDPDLDFDTLSLITGVHYLDVKEKDGTLKEAGKFVVVYHAHSITKKHKLAFKVETPLSDPHIPSLDSVWRAANWHERETYDLIGITFDGHPNLTRILLPDDWEGHPLRKDYVFPKDYRGIPLNEDAPAVTAETYYEETP